MKILFLGINYAPEPVGIGPYTTGTAESLAAAGHEVRAVVAKPYYPGWSVAREWRGGWRSSVENGVALIRCPLYVPARPSGAKRLIHHASFGLSALVPMLYQALRFRPDVIFTAAPSLIASPVAWLAARLVGARLWIHVQDFEVEAAFATGLVEQGGLAARTAIAFQNMMLRAADRVSTISAQMCAKLRAAGVEPGRISEFRNWAEIDHIRPLTGASPYRAAWGLEGRKVALYSGNIANKQGIGIVLDAARLLADRRDITFVICGEGPNRAMVEHAAADLPNMLLQSLQPKEALGDLLGLADVHLLPQLAGAADLVLPSKLANMMASGKPVVATADAGTGIADEVASAGLVVPAGDAAALAAAIVALVDDPAQAAALGGRGVYAPSNAGAAPRSWPILLMLWLPTVPSGCPLP